MPTTHVPAVAVAIFRERLLQEGVDKFIVADVEVIDDRQASDARLRAQLALNGETRKLLGGIADAVDVDIRSCRVFGSIRDADHELVEASATHEIAVEPLALFDGKVHTVRELAMGWLSTG